MEFLKKKNETPSTISLSIENTCETNQLNINYNNRIIGLHI